MPEIAAAPAVYHSEWLALRRAQCERMKKAPFMVSPSTEFILSGVEGLRTGLSNQNGITKLAVTVRYVIGIMMWVLYG